MRYCLKKKRATPGIICLIFLSVQFTQSCPTLCDPVDCNMPGLPVHHQLPKLTQTHVHRVGDAIQPSHPVAPFSSCPQAFPAWGSFPVRSQLFISGGQSIGASASASVLPKNSHGWFPLGLTGLILLSKGLFLPPRSCWFKWLWVYESESVSGSVGSDHLRLHGL